MILILLFLTSITSALSTFNIDHSIIPKLLEYGPVAKVVYGFQHKKGQENFETKIWFQINISKEDPSKALATVVRLDNIQEEHGKNLKNVREHFKSDLLWRDIQGWSSDVSIQLDYKHELLLPPNLQTDTMQFELDNLYYNFKPIPLPSPDRKIPSIIHQITSNVKGQKMKVVEKATILVQLKNQNYDHREYSLDEMPSLIESLEGIRAREAFEKLIPGAYKADLLRLVVLKHYGGHYLDSKLIPMKPFDEVIRNQSYYLCQGKVRDWVQNAYMSFEPDYYFVDLAINQIIYNTETEFYGENGLCPTGPMMISELMKKHSISLLLECKSFGGTGLFHNVKSEEPVIIYHSGEYRRMVNIYPMLDYGKMWRDRRIYKKFSKDAGNDMIIDYLYDTHLHDY